MARSVVVLLRSFGRDCRGATAIEYCFIASLVAMSIVLGVSVIGTKLNRTFNSVSTGFR